MDMFGTELTKSGIPTENIFYLNLENDNEDVPYDHRMLTDLVKSKMEVGKGESAFSAWKNHNSEYGMRKVGPPRFELELRAPQARRIPSYPTGPQYGD